MRKIIHSFLIFVFIFTTLSFLVPQAEAAEIGGYIDGIDYDNDLTYNQLVGWAYDPRSLGAPVSVEIYIDEKSAGTATVNVYRPDVSQVMGTGEYQGFRWDVPHEYFDGKAHDLSAYAINLNIGSRVQLAGSPMTFMKEDPGLLGAVDIVEVANPQNPETFVKGWAFDNVLDDVEVPIVIFESTFRTGKILGSGVANVSRTDVDAAYGVGYYHGFAVPVDLSGYESGDYLYLAVYGIDAHIGELKRIGRIMYQIP